MAAIPVQKSQHQCKFFWYPEQLVSTLDCSLPTVLLHEIIFSVLQLGQLHAADANFNPQTAVDSIVGSNGHSDVACALWNTHKPSIKEQTISADNNIITPALLSCPWISTAAFGVMVAFWQAGCHLWICQQQDATLLCFCHSEHQDKSPCSLLPRGSAQQLPVCQTPLSQLPKQSGPSRKAAVRLLEKTAGNFFSNSFFPMHHGAEKQPVHRVGFCL